MPAPTNTSALTATDLGTISTTTTTVTQQADDAGTTYQLWFSFVAPRTNVVGVFAFGDLTVYTPTTSIWDGPASAPTSYLGVSGLNVPLEFPVTEGETYFIKVLPNGGNPAPANLTLEVYEATISAVTSGSLLINGDRDDFPASVISATTGSILRWVTPFPAGEGGDSLLGGQVLVANEEVPTNLQLYTPSLTDPVTVAIAHSGGDTRIRASLDTDQWFVGQPAVGGFAKISTVSNIGAIGATTWTLAASGLDAIATSRDDSVLYYAGQPSSLGSAVLQWDLVLDMAMADLVAGIANHRIFDIIVLADDTILVMYCKPSATQAFVVKHYDDAGSTLHTYTLAAGAVFDSEVSPRLSVAEDDPDSFWVYVQTSTTSGVGFLQNIEVSTGTVLQDFPQVMFNTGHAKTDAEADPIARFGPNPSCPLILMRGAIPTSTTYPIRRQRRFLLPSSPGNRRMRMPTLELLMKTGIGLTPGPSDAPVQGQDPQIMMRISKDGGLTWGPERWRTAGQIGRYLTRVRWLQATGQYRNAVCEITVSDPVDWQFLAALAPDGIEEGSS